MGNKCHEKNGCETEEKKFWWKYIKDDMDISKRERNDINVSFKKNMYLKEIKSIASVNK